MGLMRLLPRPNVRPSVDVEEGRVPEHVLRTLAFANQKGGVAKTTTTLNLGVAFKEQGYRVLVIDLDPQGNLTMSQGMNPDSIERSMFDVLVHRVPFSEIIHSAEVDVAVASIDLAGAELALSSLIGRERALEKALVEVRDRYDFILVDTPPSLGLLTVNALVAAEEVLIPIQCEFYALEGLSQLLKNIEMVRSHLNRDLHVSTILLTMYDGRTRLAEQVAQEVRTHFGELVVGSTIPRSVRISEAPGYGQTVMTYDPMSRGALAYADAAREIALRSNGSGAETPPGDQAMEWRAE